MTTELLVNGVSNELEEQEIDGVKFVECPSCLTLNKLTRTFCSNCHELVRKTECDICSGLLRDHDRCKLCSILLHDRKPEYLDMYGRQHTARSIEYSNVCAGCVENYLKKGQYVELLNDDYIALHF